MIKDQEKTKLATTMLAVMTLILTVSLSLPASIGTAFAQTPTGTCTVNANGQITCSGTVQGLEAAIAECTREIKRNAQTNAIIEDTGVQCQPAQGGDEGTVRVTGTIPATTTCTTRMGNPVPGQGGTTTLQFSGESGTVSGGTQEITTTTTRLVGQGQGSNEPTIDRVEGAVTGAVSAFTISPTVQGQPTQCQGEGLTERVTFGQPQADFQFI